MKNKPAKVESSVGSKLRTHGFCKTRKKINKQTKIHPKKPEKTTPKSPIQASRGHSL